MQNTIDIVDTMGYKQPALLSTEREPITTATESLPEEGRAEPGKREDWNAETSSDDTPRFWAHTCSDWSSNENPTYVHYPCPATFYIDVNLLRPCWSSSKKWIQIFARERHCSR